MSFLHKNVVNFYTPYKLDAWSKDTYTDFVLGSCLFGAVKITKNADPDKYRCSGYSIGFDARSHFYWSHFSKGKKIKIFDGDMSSSIYIDNKNKNILLLGEGPTQGLDNCRN